MRRGLCVALGFACLWTMTATLAAAPPATATPPGVGGNAQTRKALEAVEKVLRGERVSELDLKGLDNAVIRLETASPAGGLGTAEGVEASSEGGRAAPRNVYILRFDSGASGERQLQVLRIQREILKNQLVLLKSLSTIAGYQANLGTRTARVENIMRDVTLGMKDSGTAIQKVAGDTAGTSAKMTDVASTTSDMAEGMKEMAKNIDDIEGAISNVDSMISKMASSIESQAFDEQRERRKMGRDLEWTTRSAGRDIISRIDKNTDRLESEMGDLGSDLSGQIGEIEVPESFSE